MASLLQAPVMAFFTPGPMEMLIIGIVAVLLFGKRLPEVGRSLGKGLVEFKRGMNGVQDEFNSVTRSVDDAARKATQFDPVDDGDEPTAPKFEPPTSEPKDESVTA